MTRNDSSKPNRSISTDKHTPKQGMQTRGNKKKMVTMDDDPNKRKGKPPNDADLHRSTPRRNPTTKCDYSVLNLSDSSMSEDSLGSDVTTELMDRMGEQGTVTDQKKKRDVGMADTPQKGKNKKKNKTTFLDELQDEEMEIADALDAINPENSSKDTSSPKTLEQLFCEERDKDADEDDTTPIELLDTSGENSDPDYAPPKTNHKNDEVLDKEFLEVETSEVNALLLDNILDEALPPPPKAKVFNYDEEDEENNGDTPPAARPATYKEAASSSNAIPASGLLTFKETKDPDKSIRFRFNVEVLKSENALEKIAKTVRTIFQKAQEYVGKSLHLASWDYEAVKRTFNMESLPTGQKKNDLEILRSITNDVIRTKPKTDYTYWGKLHFVTKSPELCEAQLSSIGQLIFSEMREEQIFIARNPHHMACARHKPLGYFQFSCKQMDSQRILEGIRQLPDFPANAIIGLHWRRITNVEGKPYVSDDNGDPPMALHIDCDPNHRYILMDVLTNAYKRKSKHRLLHASLRFIAGLDSFKGPLIKTLKPEEGQSESLLTTTLILHQKQKFFINEHIHVLEADDIMALDIPAKDAYGTEWNMEKFIMSQCPSYAVTQRIFVCVSRKWDGKYVMVTTIGHMEEALGFMASMVPQSIVRFGLESVRRWWTPTALQNYANVRWDASKGLTMGKEFDPDGMLDDDPYQMNVAWNAAKTQKTYSVKDPPSKAPALDLTKPTKTVAQTLADRTCQPSDDQSIGRYIGRPHDGDTVVTEVGKGETLPEEPQEGQVRFQTVPTEVAAAAAAPIELDSASVSTLGSALTGDSRGTAATTASTRKNLAREKRISTHLRMENLQLAKEHEEATKRADEMEAQLAAFRQLALDKGIDIHRLGAIATPSNAVRPASVTPGDKRRPAGLNMEAGKGP
jgi:hypothetical protein